MDAYGIRWIVVSTGQVPGLMRMILMLRMISVNRTAKRSGLRRMKTAARWLYNFRYLPRAPS